MDVNEKEIKSVEGKLAGQNGMFRKLKQEIDYFKYGQGLWDVCLNLREVGEVAVAWQCPHCGASHTEVKDVLENGKFVLQCSICGTLRLKGTVYGRDKK